LRALFTEAADEIERLRMGLAKVADYYEKTWGPHMGMNGLHVGARIRAAIFNQPCQ